MQIATQRYLHIGKSIFQLFCWKNVKFIFKIFERKEGDSSKYPEIANVIFIAVNCQVGRFFHAVRTVEPLDQIAVLRNAEHGREHGIDGHDVALLINSQTGNNIDVTNDNKEEK